MVGGPGSRPTAGLRPRPAIAAVWDRHRRSRKVTILTWDLQHNCNCPGNGAIWRRQATRLP